MEERTQPPTAAAKASILVVEDEAIIANDIKLTLESGGYRVTSVVGTGARAVRKAEADCPDLVLMDIVLPGELDGIHAAQLIRARQDIPVIYLTAYTDESMVSRALDSEPFGYIAKPFSESELYRTIEIALFKHRLERRLRESEEWLSATLRSIGDAVVATGKEGRIRFMNPAAEALLGWSREEAGGRPLAEILVFREQGADSVSTPFGALLDPEPLERKLGDYVIATRNGDEKHVTLSSAPIADPGGNVLGTVLAVRDISAQKAAETELRRSREELKIHVEEVQERNIALKVLLEQREHDRGEFEDRIMENLRTMVLPYLVKLKARRPGPQEAALLNIIETNLLHITSEFSRKLSSRFRGLSPQELRVANLVKEGLQDKEIMDLLNISFETVKTHRQNIRKKLGIYGERGGLRSHLSHYSD